MIGIITLHACSYLKVHHLNPNVPGNELWYPNKVDDSLISIGYYCGLWTPAVFNKADLEMSNQWAVIYRLGENPDGSEKVERVPYQDENGERLSMHLSDRFYFGNSVIWRRILIGKDLVAAHQPQQPGLFLLGRVVASDYRKQEFTEPVGYRIDLFQNNSTNYKVTDDSKYEPRLVYSFKLNFTP